MNLCVKNGPNWNGANRRFDIIQIELGTICRQLYCSKWVYWMWAQWTMKNYERRIGAKKRTARKKNGAICSESSTDSVGSWKIEPWVTSCAMTNDCHKKYKMANHKKLEIKNHTNLAHEFVWNSACILKEINSKSKKGKPPWAQVGGNLYNWYEIFIDTHKKRWMVRFFLCRDYPENNPENEIVRIHSQCI